MTCAPSRISRLLPALRAESIGPGTAATTRPNSRAWVAVFTAPDLNGASTTMVTSASAAIIRFRRGKHPGAARLPGARSDNTSPEAAISRCNARCPTGYGTSTPVPSTAIVSPFAASAPRWAAESIPLANPLTTAIPALANALASSSATRMPYGDASRVPTMATDRRGARCSTIPRPNR